MTALKARVRPLWWAAVLVVVGACGDTAGEPATTTSALAQETTTTAAAVDESGLDAASGIVAREWWKDLGLVVTPDVLGFDPLLHGVSDIKVAELPQGGYVATVSFFSTLEPLHIPTYILTLESPDLVEWREIARSDLDDLLEQGFYIGTLLALPDGTLKMIAVSDRPGEPVLASTSVDGGRTWMSDPTPLLTAADFGDDLRLVVAAVVERPEGGWRMYVSANDCAAPNQYGGDNCPFDEALMTWSEGASSIYSAVSTDLVEWTVEPGVRFRASLESGSIDHHTAWIDDEGRVRITGGMRWNPEWVFPEDSPRPEPGWTLSQMIPHGGAIMELVSDDGLVFDLADYRDYRFPVGDPQVVRSPDGSFAMLVGSQGQDEVLELDHQEWDQRGGIRLFSLVTIDWEIDPTIPFPVLIQSEVDEPMYSCYRIDVRGSGTVRFEVRASGWPFTPGTAAPDLYRISDAVVEAPGSVYITVADHIFDPDFDSRLYAGNIVAVDEDGISWFIQPFPYRDFTPGSPYFTDGHEFESFPCPP